MSFCVWQYIVLCPHCFYQVLNKIDLPGAEPDRVSKEIEEVANIYIFASLNGCLVNLLLEYLHYCAHQVYDFIVAHLEVAYFYHCNGPSIK